MHDFDRAMSPAGGARRRGVALGVLSAAAALLHLAALGGAAWVWPSAEPPPLPSVATRAVSTTSAMEVRVVEAVTMPAAPPPATSVQTLPAVASVAPPPAVTSVAVALPEAHPTREPARAATAPSRPPVPRAARAAVAAVPVPVPVIAAVAVAPRRDPAPAPPDRAAAVVASAESVESVARVAALPAVLAPAEAPVAPQVALATEPPGSAAAAAAAAAHADDDAIPHYRTRLPPATALRYEMQRGVLRGTGDLFWRPQGDRYELRLEARVGALAVLTQVSTGGFDAAGVAPLRFTDQRLRRSPTAANFQRGGVDKITYSGSPSEFALRPGAQDRLSWMVQLAAIIGGEPALAQPGARIAMLVTGSRGDAGVWVFRCIGPERVAARGGQVDAVKFVREPREAHDTSVEVWLDPTLHDLPLRAVQRSGPNDEAYELRLLETLPAN